MVPSRSGSRRGPRSAVRVSELGDGVRFEVRVSPRASRDAVIGVHEGALKVALTAPPVDGAANAALISFLASSLGVPKRAISLVRGETGRSKLVEVEGVTAEAIQNLLP